MTKQFLCSLILAGTLVGSAQAAGPDLDLSQPPDPQPAGGPTGDGGDWEGDGRAPLTDDASDADGSAKSPSGKGTGEPNAMGPQNGKLPSKGSGSASDKAR